MGCLNFSCLPTIQPWGLALSSSRQHLVEGLILEFPPCWNVAISWIWCGGHWALCSGWKKRGGVIWSLGERCRRSTHWACLVVVTELGQSSGTGLAGGMWWLGRPDAGLASWWAGRAVPLRILLFCITVSVILAWLQFSSSLHTGARCCESWCGWCVEDYLIRLFYWFYCSTFLKKYYLCDGCLRAVTETSLRCNNSLLLRWDGLALPVIHPALLCASATYFLWACWAFLQVRFACQLARNSKEWVVFCHVSCLNQLREGPGKCLMIVQKC